MTGPAKLGPGGMAADQPGPQCSAPIMTEGRRGIFSQKGRIFEPLKFSAAAWGMHVACMVSAARLHH